MSFRYIMGLFVGLGYAAQATSESEAVQSADLSLFTATAPSERRLGDAQHCAHATKLYSDLVPVNCDVLQSNTEALNSLLAGHPGVLDHHGRILEVAERQIHTDENGQYSTTLLKTTGPDGTGDAAIITDPDGKISGWEVHSNGKTEIFTPCTYTNAEGDGCYTVVSLRSSDPASINTTPFLSEEPDDAVSQAPIANDDVTYIAENSSIAKKETTCLRQLAIDFYYEESAESSEKKATTHALGRIAEMNAALSNTRTNGASISSKFEFILGKVTIIPDLDLTDSYSQLIHVRDNIQGAKDVIKTLVVANSSGCGRAYLDPRTFAGKYLSDYMAAVIPIGCDIHKSFSHEWAHLFGGRHDSLVTTARQPDNYAYIETSGDEKDNPEYGMGTILAYVKSFTDGRANRYLGFSAGVDATINGKKSGDQNANNAKYMLQSLTWYADHFKKVCVGSGVTMQPTTLPTSYPSKATSFPSTYPTYAPSRKIPTSYPTKKITGFPTANPTLVSANPTMQATAAPVQMMTRFPTASVPTNGAAEDKTSLPNGTRRLRQNNPW